MLNICGVGLSEVLGGLLLEKELGERSERKGKKQGWKGRGRREKYQCYPNPGLLLRRKLKFGLTPFLNCNRVLIGCERERVRCKGTVIMENVRGVGRGELSTLCFTMVVTLIKTCL